LKVPLVRVVGFARLVPRPSGGGRLGDHLPVGISFAKKGDIFELE